MHVRAIHWCLIGVLCVMGVVGVAVADEQKEIVVKGSRPSFGTLAQTGSVSLFSRDGQHDFAIVGTSATLDRVDGRNHDLSGNLVGSGDRPGAATDVSGVFVRNVTLVGSVAMQEQVAPFDVAAYSSYLQARANLTLTSDTTYNGGTIGGPSNYQIVVVKDVKLVLSGGFTGYGVLLLYDTDPDRRKVQLEMRDRATWYGTILSYTAPAAGDIDRTLMLLGRQSSGSVGAGQGVRVYGQVIIMSKQALVGFPLGAVADLYYSSASVANVDALLQTKAHAWSGWREVE